MQFSSIDIDIAKFFFHSSSTDTIWLFKYSASDRGKFDMKSPPSPVGNRVKVQLKR